MHNYVGAHEFHVQSSNGLSQGRHRLRFEFERTGEPSIQEGKGAPGQARLYVDDELVGSAEIPVTIPLTFGLCGGLRCGRAPVSPITELYRPPFAFTGKLERVTVEVGREALIRDHEAEVRAAMARQ